MYPGPTKVTGAVYDENDAARIRSFSRSSVVTANEISDDDTEVARKQPRITLVFVLVVLASCLGSFSAGYDTGVIAGALLYIEQDFPIDEEPLLEGLIVSITIVGQLIASWFSFTSFGRRIPLFIASLLYIIGASLMFWSPRVEVLISGRFCVGYAVGIVNVVVPLYLAECALTKQRGALMMSPYLSNIFGVFTSYMISFAITTTPDPSWRLMLGVSVIPAVIMFLCLFILTESPRVLISRGKLIEARAALSRLRGIPDVTDEFNEIVRGMLEAARHSATGPVIQNDKPPPYSTNDNVPTEDLDSALVSDAPTESSSLLPKPDEKSLTFLQLLRQPGVKRALFLAICVTAFQQFSGINAIVFYLPQILQDAGIDELLAGLGFSEDSVSILATALVYACKIPFMILTTQIVDVIGRRAVILTAIPVMCLALVGLAVSDKLPDDSSAGSILALVSSTVFGISFSPGLGATATVVLAEIMPQSFRSTGFSLALVSSNFFNIVVTQLFPLMNSVLGPFVTFLIFASSSFLAFFFFLFMIPETKLKTLEQASESLVRTEEH